METWNVRGAEAFNPTIKKIKICFSGTTRNKVERKVMKWNMFDNKQEVQDNTIRIKNSSDKMCVFALVFFSIILYFYNISLTFRIFYLMYSRILLLSHLPLSLQLEAIFRTRRANHNKHDRTNENILSRKGEHEFNDFFCVEFLTSCC